MTTNDVFARLPKVPSFTVQARAWPTASRSPPAQLSGICGIPEGRDASPQLSWAGAPPDT